jgi:hypothetical protein
VPLFPGGDGRLGSGEVALDRLGGDDGGDRRLAVPWFSELVQPLIEYAEYAASRMAVVRG